MLLKEGGSFNSASANCAAAAAKIGDTDFAKKTANLAKIQY